MLRNRNTLCCSMAILVLLKPSNTHEHLTATETRYPGTNLILKYAIKTKTPALIN